jgi:predicted secreted protein
MDNISIYLENEKRKFLLESLFQEMKVRFEVKELNNQPLLSQQEFISKINKCIKQAKSGNTVDITNNKQKEFLGL